MSAPRVTVLLPVHNGLPYLREALDSLAAQTFRDFVTLVVDDGSDDGTRDLLRRVQSRRVQILRTERAAFATTLNRGLHMIDTPLVARHDAADRSRPDRLVRQVAYLDAHPEVGLVATAVAYIDADGREVENDWTRAVRREIDPATTPEAIRALMPLTCCITHGSILARRDLLLTGGGYRAALAPNEDYDLWLRALPSWRFAKLPERLYEQRLSGLESPAATPEPQLRNRIRAQLDFARRAHPWLPAPAGLLVADETGGAPYYHQLAREFWLVERARPACADVPPDADACAARIANADWDLLAVTDVTNLPRYAAALAPALHAGRIVQEGNLFLRHPEDLS